MPVSFCELDTNPGVDRKEGTVIASIKLACRKVCRGAANRIQALPPLPGCAVKAPVHSRVCKLPTHALSLPVSAPVWSQALPTVYLCGQASRTCSSLPPIPSDNAVVSSVVTEEVSFLITSYVITSFGVPTQLICFFVSEQGFIRNLSVFGVSLGEAHLVSKAPAAGDYLVFVAVSFSSGNMLTLFLFF